MKKVIYIIFILLGCNSSLSPLPIIYGETIEGEPFIMGKINRQNLLIYEHSEWFQEEYNRYKVPIGWVEKNKVLLKKMNLKLFLGTWCEDSES